MLVSQPVRGARAVASGGSPTETWVGVTGQRAAQRELACWMGKADKPAERARGGVAAGPHFAEFCPPPSFLRFF